MNLKDMIEHTFGKDLFSHLKHDELLEERIKIEKRIEHVSNEIKNIQDKIQQLMLDAKGQTKTYKMLNIQKIKALKLEANTKVQEAGTELRKLQLILLVEAMKEQKKAKENDEMIEKIMHADMEKVNKILFDKDVKKAVEEGKMDEVKEKLKGMFAKEEMTEDKDSMDLLNTIDDLEKVDEEAALQLAGERARKVADVPTKKKLLEEEI